MNHEISGQVGCAAHVYTYRAASRHGRASTGAIKVPFFFYEAHGGLREKWAKFCT